MIMPGVVALQLNQYHSPQQTLHEMNLLNDKLKLNLDELTGIPLIIVCDDANFTAQTLNNFVWVAFTRCNPSHDIHGIAAFTENKHWGCNGPMIIDARIKPHHAPVLQKEEAVERRVDEILAKYKF
jgi:4-hydroxy-3-polyprenylbenzoate decarboxylase